MGSCAFWEGCTTFWLAFSPDGSCARPTCLSFRGDLNPAFFAMRWCPSLLFLLPLSAPAQQTVLVADSATGRGLPYASVASTTGNWGTATDSAGRVTLP